MRIYKSGEKYRVDFTWQGGRVRLVGFSDKRATQKLADNLEELAACREAGARPDRELSSWLESLPVNMQEKLAAKGLIDNRRLEAVKSLKDQVEDYEDSMKAKKRSQRHINQEINKILRGYRGV